MNWRHGTLVTPPTPTEPESLGEDDSIAALLDAAEDIVNSAGPQIMADVEAEQSQQKQSRFRLPKWLRRGD